MDNLLASRLVAAPTALPPFIDVNRSSLSWRATHRGASSYLAGRKASRRVSSPHTGTRRGTPNRSAKKTAGRQKS